MFVYQSGGVLFGLGNDLICLLLRLGKNLLCLCFRILYDLICFFLSGAGDGILIADDLLIFLDLIRSPETKLH